MTRELIGSFESRWLRYFEPSEVTSLEGGTEIFAGLLYDSTVALIVVSAVLVVVVKVLCTTSPSDPVVMLQLTVPTCDCAPDVAPGDETATLSRLKS